MINIVKENNSATVIAGDRTFRYLFLNEAGAVTVRFLPPQRNERFSKDFAEILAFLTKDLGTKITLKRVCSEFYTNKRTVENLFRENVGMTFHKYMTELRLGMAIALLLTPNGTTSTIASATGFSTPQNFSKFFSKHLGLSPSEFRMQLQLKLFGFLNDFGDGNNPKEDFEGNICIYVHCEKDTETTIKSSVAVTPPPPRNLSFLRLTENCDNETEHE